MTLEIRRALSAADLEQCYEIRMEVFVEEQKVPPAEEIDAYDEQAEHFLALEDGSAVATARLVDLGGGVGKIGRVAVRRPARGGGIGRALMQEVIGRARGRHDTLVLDAQLPVIPFYERLGFATEGDVFLDAGIEHRRMKLTGNR